MVSLISQPLAKILKSIDSSPKTTTLGHFAMGGAINRPDKVKQIILLKEPAHNNLFECYVKTMSMVKLYSTVMSLFNRSVKDEYDLIAMMATLESEVLVQKILLLIKENIIRGNTAQPLFRRHRDVAQFRDLSDDNISAIIRH